MSFTALSVIQPWPYMILRPDVTDAGHRADLRATKRIKDCENREWETPVRGWVLIHASSSRQALWDYRASALFAAKRGVDVPLRDNLPYGAVVGAARVDDCTWTYRSPWFVGPRAFIFGASVPFAEPIECEGRPRFFQLPLDERSAANGARWTGEQRAAHAAASRILWQRIAAAVVAAGLQHAFRINLELLRPLEPTSVAAQNHETLL